MERAKHRHCEEEAFVLVTRNGKSSRVAKCSKLSCVWVGFDNYSEWLPNLAGRADINTLEAEHRGCLGKVG